MNESEAVMNDAFWLTPADFPAFGKGGFRV
jgi:hypothetical protein